MPNSTGDRKVWERKGRLSEMDRSFDIQFWQAQGPEAIFNAAWEMVQQAWTMKGRDLAELEFRRSVEHFQRGRRKVLIVGGYAIMFYAEPRYTKDLDVWVEPTPENAIRVFKALSRFGAPLKEMSAADFETVDSFYQLGQPPNRVDILTSITGVEFSEAWARRRESTFGGLRILFLSKEDLIRNKRASGRLRDLADIESLEQS